MTPSPRAASKTGARAAQVLAVTGMTREAKLVGGPGVVTIGAGGDPERLRTMLATPRPDLRAVISIGVAGGLDPDLVPGDVVVATGVRAEGGRRYRADRNVVTALADVLAAGPFRVFRGEVAGVEAAVLSPFAKRELHATTGALAVDMESHVAAEFARESGLPFSAIRIVCDPADRALPAFVARALKPNGDVDILQVLGALAMRSAKVGGLVRLARDSAAAFDSLRRCCALLGPGLGVPSLGVADFGELLRDVA